MKVSLTVLCLALAVAAASAAAIDEMHSKLAAVDPSLAAISGSKASTMGYAKDDYYKEDYYKYEDKYEKKYDDKYEKYDKYDKYDKYEKKYDDKYEKKYDDKYEKKYDDKYEKKYDDKYSDKYYDYKSGDSYYGYDNNKITIKLWEKKRGGMRANGANADTYQFSSVVTCDNPKHVKDVHSHDGLIDMPVNPELKTTPVGVCEWTITKTKAQAISDNAEIRGSSTVVCTFTEEAERTCKGDFLCDKMSISGQGLLYNFKQATDYSYKKDEYKKDEPTDLDMDVLLTIVNGVNGHKHKSEYDNGVIQFFVGPEKPTGDAAKDYAAIKAADYDATNPQGALTIVLKSGDKGKY